MSTLNKNDILLTGTPGGVGAVKTGDHINCELNDQITGQNLLTMKFIIANK